MVRALSRQITQQVTKLHKIEQEKFEDKKTNETEQSAQKAEESELEKEIPPNETKARIKVTLGTLSELLANELRPIFKEKRARRREAMHKMGGNIGVVKRISEIAQNIDAFDSKAWEKRTKPTDLDYIFTLLVDLSGSMVSQKKAFNAFLGAASVGEALQKLAIPVNIISFTDRILLYKDFRESLTRENYCDMWNDMSKEVHCDHARYNSDGWAVAQATHKLQKQTGNQKYLIVFSDGMPVPSPKHREFKLAEQLNYTQHKLKTLPIGIGIGDEGCQAVKRYYKHNVVCPSVVEFPFHLINLVKEIIGRKK